MQAMPEIKTPRIHPPIALFKDAPKNNPTTAHKIIIITDTTVLNFFIQSHSFVKLELAYFFFCLCLMIAFITKQISNTTMVNAPYTKMLVYQGADCIAYSSGRVLKFQTT